MNERAKEIVDALIDAVRGVVVDKQIDYDEYRAGVDFLVRAGNELARGHRVGVELLLGHAEVHRE